MKKEKTMTLAAAREICQRFAAEHKIVFEEEGECGFGRECVGFTSGRGYIDHNPISVGNNYERIKDLECKDCYPPSGVEAYHKHDCLAVLGRGKGAIIGLASWVQKLEAAGKVSVVEYRTGATGIQAVLSGVVGKAVVVKP
jgi:hypothetical protein